MDSYKTWEDTGINLKGKVSGEHKYICPKCPPDRGNPKDTSLSVNITKRTWYCHYCQWKGGLTNAPFEVKKNFKKPEFNPNELSDKMADWFLKNRGITRETLQKFMVSPNKKYIAKAGKEVQVIAFPYIKNSEIVNVKSRYDYVEDKQNRKTFTMEAECELSFYNIDSIEGFTHCVIVEGEIDVLSVVQATGQPCISVPNGASKGEIKMEYLDNCASYFDNKTLICLATDNDEPGINLRNELARRLGKDRCFYVTYPDGCKDMNEVLLKHGPEYLEEMFQNLTAFPIEGVITLENVEAEIDHYYKNGFPTGDSIGYPSFDKLLTFRGGEITTITGIPSHGKSEWLDEILVQLSRRHNWPHGLFAAENGKPALHYTRIANRYIERPFYRHNEDYKMSPQQLADAKEFMANHFYFINNRQISKVTDILDKAKELVLRYGIKSLTIDPYGCMESERPKNLSEAEYVGYIYKSLIQFAELYNVHIFLVAHPTKMQKDKRTGLYEVPTMYSISGSAKFYDSTYNGISVYRDFEAQETTVYVQKVKFDFMGKVGYSSFTYNGEKRRYIESI